MTNTILPDFPFESKFITIHRSNMHYIDEGSGDPILFLHGNPTSSYLWRNIIPHLILSGRCIAPDLIGMGKSDKPNLKYRFVDHYNYIEEFIHKLNLSNITLVLHDWGSVIGFHYAMMNQNRIKGIAFMEAMVKPRQWSDFKDPRAKIIFKLMRQPFIGWFLICFLNVFIRVILPKAVNRKLSNEELSAYNYPYKKMKARKPLRQWPLETPINGKPSHTYKIISIYSDKLKVSKLPKLLFYANPGSTMHPEIVNWCNTHLPNLTAIDIGKGIHFLQEDNPHFIGEQLAKWYKLITY